MKATVVGLVTPHLLKVVDLAKEAESGVNVDWHLRDAVAKTIDELGHQYNALDLLSAYAKGLQTAAHEATQSRKRVYAGVLQRAAAIAARSLTEPD